MKRKKKKQWFSHAGRIHCAREIGKIRPLNGGRRRTKWRKGTVAGMIARKRNAKSHGRRQISNSQLRGVPPHSTACSRSRHSRHPKSLFGYNGSAPFPHTNDPFPSVSKRREDHFHSRNDHPTERNRRSQTGSY